MKSKVIAFCNHKGGVGKTTSVISLGSIFAKRGSRTLLIDLDAQSNLTFSLMAADGTGLNTYTAIKSRGNLPQIQVDDNLYLSPSSLDLAAIESEMASQIGRERALQKALAPIRGDYDYILIDCAPSLGLLLINALTAADRVYIPTIAEALAYTGLNSLEGIISQVKEYLNSNLSVGGIFFTRWSNRKLNKEVEEAAKEKYGDLLLSTKIRENISIAEAPLTRKSIIDYSPSSNGAADYNLLADEVLRREGII